VSWRAASLRARLERLEQRRGLGLDQTCPSCGGSPFVIRFHEFGEWEDGQEPPCPTCLELVRTSGQITTMCIRRHGDSCRICDEVAKLENEAREED
jgi:hypothetical protein